jgi:hypothetical protein
MAVVQRRKNTGNRNVKNENNNEGIQKQCCSQVRTRETEQWRTKTAMNAAQWQWCSEGRTQETERWRTKTTMNKTNESNAATLCWSQPDPWMPTRFSWCLIHGCPTRFQLKATHHSPRSPACRVVDLFSYGSTSSMLWSSLFYVENRWSYSFASCIC